MPPEAGRGKLLSSPDGVASGRGRRGGRPGRGPRGARCSTDRSGHPGARLFVVPHAGHLLPMAAPRAFEAIVRGSLPPGHQQTHGGCHGPMPLRHAVLSDRPPPRTLFSPGHSASGPPPGRAGSRAATGSCWEQGRPERHPETCHRTHGVRCFHGCSSAGVDAVGNPLGRHTRAGGLGRLPSARDSAGLMSAPAAASAP
jgi:hypothetical protein